MKGYRERFRLAGVHESVSKPASWSPKSSGSLKTPRLRLLNRYCVSQINRTAAFGYIISIPSRNFHGDVALHHGLAPETGVQCQTGGHLDAVGFIVFHFRKICVTRFHDHVARGTGATPAASVFELKAVVQRNIQKRTAEAMFGVGHAFRVVVDRDVLGKKGNFGHYILRVANASNGCRIPFVDLFDRV